MAMDLISVIVPVYNVEKYLNQCVESLFHQTYRNLEIILVDDGSKDSSGEICDKLAKKDKRVKVIHKANGGLSSARNAGLECATGEYIGFVDSDDFLAEKAVEELHDVFLQYPQCGISSCMIISYVEGNTGTFRNDWLIKENRIIPADEFAEKLLLTQVNHSVCTKLFSRKVIDGLLFEVGKINEDVLFMLPLSLRMKELNLDMVEIPYLGYYYRMTPNSITHSAVAPVAFTAIKNYQDMSERTKEIDSLLSKKLLQSSINETFHFYCMTLSDADYSQYQAEYKQIINGYGLGTISSFSVPFRTKVKYCIARFLPLGISKAIIGHHDKGKGNV